MTGITEIHLHISISRDKLACLILEALYQASPPDGLTPTEALEIMPEETQADMRRAAVAAARYMQSCINEAIATSQHAPEEATIQ
jgi:hypothetical protein